MGYRVYGLTGGVASGKSTAAQIFEQLGIPVIDADQIARELSAPTGAAAPAILARFGTLDRKILRDRVFSNETERKDLEAILHPLIQAESMSRVKSLGAPVVIYEAALLVETNRFQDLAGLIVVTAPVEKRIQRMIARDAVTRELAEKIIASQITDAQRTAVATHVLENHLGLQELKEKVSKIGAMIHSYSHVQK